MTKEKTSKPFGYRPDLTVDELWKEAERRGMAVTFTPGYAKTAWEQWKCSGYDVELLVDPNALTSLDDCFYPRVSVRGSGDTPRAALAGALKNAEELGLSAED